MAAAPELNARTGQLWLARDTFEALVTHVLSAGDAGEPEAAADPVAAGGSGFTVAQDQLGLLRATGVIDSDDRPHDAIGGTLAAISEPAFGTVELSYNGKTMHGWIGEDGVAFLLPAGEDGRHLLTHMPLSLAPGTLAKLVDLGPRLRPEPARPVPYEEGAFTDVRRHWLLLFHEPPSTRASNGKARNEPGAALEVVDTDSGVWVIEPGEDADQRVAWPSTPTSVWRKIARIVRRVIRTRPAAV